MSTFADSDGLPGAAGMSRLPSAFTARMTAIAPLAIALLTWAVRAAALAPWSIITILPAAPSGAVATPVPAYTTSPVTGLATPVCLPFVEEANCQFGPLGSVAFGDVTLATARLPINGNASTFTSLKP